MLRLPRRKGALPGTKRFTQGALSGRHPAMKGTAAICISCLLAFLMASPALAYRRDVQGQPAASAAAGEAPEGQPEPGQGQHPSDWDTGSPGGSGTVTWGYVLLGVGGAAAIAGSTIVAATDKRTTGIIVGSAGATMSLVGTMMIMMGGRGYAVGPAVDPGSGSYGLAVAANF
jgi:hypothetical protein